MDKRTLTEVLTHGFIPDQLVKNERQGICRTKVAPISYEGHTVKALVKYYHDYEGTLNEGRKEMAARYVAKHFPFVELPVAVLRTVPDFEDGWGKVTKAPLAGVQQFVEDAIVTCDVPKYDKRGLEWDDIVRLDKLADNERFRRDAIAACLYDMVVYHPDKHEGNWLFRPNPKRAYKRHIVNIDHGLCFNYTWDGAELGCCGYYRDFVKGAKIPTDMRKALVVLASKAKGLEKFGIEPHYCTALAARALSAAKMEVLR